MRRAYSAWDQQNHFARGVIGVPRLAAWFESCLDPEPLV
jgi:hypothetical protein